MTENNHKWWSVVPVGATLQNKDAMHGVAVFTHDDQRWLVDLFDDTAVACTQETIDALGCFPPQAVDATDTVALLRHYASLHGVGDDVAATELRAADEIERLQAELAALRGSSKPAQPTAIIHDVIADNDVLTDNGWDGVAISIALNHNTWKIEGADTSTEALTARLIAEGYKVLHEDDEYSFTNGRWTREGA